MKLNELEDDLVELAVETYFEGRHLISVERENSELVVVTKQLPIEN